MPANSGSYQDKQYVAVNWRMLDFLRPEDRRVLDIGCGTGGAVAAMACRGLDAVGLTISEEEAAIGRRYGLDIRAGDCSGSLDFEDGSFDSILMSHVLEHLAYPSDALRNLTRLLAPGGRFLIAVPNIAYWRPRLQLALGRFPQEEFGHFDRTHLRFLTFQSARRMVEDAGLKVEVHEAWGRRPGGLVKGLATRLVAGGKAKSTSEPRHSQATVDGFRPPDHPGMADKPGTGRGERLRQTAMRVQRVFVSMAPNFLGYEVVIVASPKAG